MENLSIKNSNLKMLKLYLRFFFLADIYSSHTSSSFSPSPSDGAATPNSLIHDRENNRLNDNTITDENECSVKKSKVSENHHQLKKGDSNYCAKDKNTKIGSGGGGDENGVVGGKGTDGNGGIGNGTTAPHQNGEGTYHCQFCDKSFPRLGYLKKHEQVGTYCF